MLGIWDHTRAMYEPCLNQVWPNFKLQAGYNYVIMALYITLKFQLLIHCSNWCYKNVQLKSYIHILYF